MPRFHPVIPENAARRSGRADMSSFECVNRVSEDLFFNEAWYQEKGMKGDGRIQTGKKGEEFAVAYLKSKGYRIIERNYKCLFGEIDIVAKDGNTLVFVEVKSRKSEDFGDPQAAVGREKQKKISRVALTYLEEKRRYSCDARFDVVAVKMLPAGNTIELIQNAFELAF